MDVDELISQAWSAVEKAGVPESVQGVAFKEAVDFLREDRSEGSSRAAANAPAARRKQGASNASKRKRQPHEESPAVEIDEAGFFGDLAAESGVEEERLRDCLHLSNGTVHVTPPGRELGDSRRAQAQTVVALVAGARSRGLAENPVNAEAVHAELKRKHCWDKNNFSNKHLGPMKGFNAGSNRTEIVLTSKWDEEFQAAVDTALGDRDDDSDG